MYICKRCWSVFSEPDSRDYWENLDGENGWWQYTEHFCPNCGSTAIEEAAEEEEAEE